MAESVTNRGKYLTTHGGLNGRDLRMLIITGTQTGVHSVDLNSVADLDAVASVSIHTERIALANVTITEDDANDRVNADADSVSFSAAPGVTAQGVAVYVHNANDASADLVSVHTTGFPQPMDGGLTVNIADFLRAS